MSEIGSAFLSATEALRPRLAEHVKANGIMAHAELQQEMADHVRAQQGDLLDALGLSESQLLGLAGTWLENTMEDLMLEQTGEGGQGHA